MTDALARVRNNLARFEPLAEAFEQIFAALSVYDDVAILASGSLAAGTMDRLSDVDLEVVAAPERTAELRAVVEKTLDRIAQPLCRFAADHLGLNDLVVSFHEAAGSVLKIDVWVMPPAGLAFIPKAVVLHDPRGLAAERPQGGGPPPRDYDDLSCKFCGWMWFTHVKIARGHFLEALESIEIMRSFALLPFLHRAENLPPEGYRLLEERLSSERLQQLYRTYPSAIDRAELYRALDELAALFASVSSNAGRVGRMRQLIADDRTRNA